MNDLDSGLIDVILVCVLIFLGFMIGLNIGAWYTHQMRVRAVLDGIEIYNGPVACIETQSIGSNSLVETKRGPWCNFTKQEYSGKDLTISPL